jgi:hypothetical protein
VTASASSDADHTVWGDQAAGIVNLPGIDFTPLFEVIADAL